MSGTQRTIGQSERNAAYHSKIALEHGIQDDTPAHVARIACINPRDLMLRPPPLSSSSGSHSSPRKPGAANPYPSVPRGAGKHSLNVIATRESVKAEYKREFEFEEKHRPSPPMACIPSGCVRVPQTVVIQPGCAVTFSKNGRQGVPQTHHQNMDGIDGCDSPFTFGTEKRLTFLLAWPGYDPIEFSMDLHKQDETTLLAVKRPICRSELASEILFFVTQWIDRKARSLNGPASDHAVPWGFKVSGGCPDIKASSIWLTKFGPEKGGDGTRWAAELYVEK